MSRKIESWQAHGLTLVGISVTTALCPLIYSLFGWNALMVLLVAVAVTGWLRGPLVGALSAVAYVQGSRLLLSVLGSGSESSSG